MFLPARLAFLALTAALALAAACGRPQEPPLPRHEAVRVVAGAGDVTPDDLARVQAAIDAELPSLQATFPGLPREPFVALVHGERAALPPHLAACLHPESPAFAVLGARQIHFVLGEARRLGTPLRGVVRHELVHELLDQRVGAHGRRVPRWFHEGLAQLLAGDTYLGAREEDLAFAALAGRLRNFVELAGDFPTDVASLREAYAQSYSYVSWLARDHGVRELVDVAAAVDDVTAFEPALAHATGRSTAWLEERWRDYVLHGSGAPWRLAFDNCFSVLLLLFLPILVLALRRHLAKEAAAGRRLAQRDAEAARAAAAAAAAAEAARRAGEPPGEPPRIG